MANSNILNEQEFNVVISNLKLPEFFNVHICYQVYLYANEAIEALYEINKNQFKKEVSQHEIIYYAAGECLYTMSAKKDDMKYFENEEIIAQIGSVVGDKYLSLSLFNHNNMKFTNKYLPPASSLDIYINLMLNIVNSYKKNDPQTTLINDLLNKSLSISRCILELLINGYETEAFSSWRTLHECECTLILLDKYGDKAINTYLKHMNYGLAFNNGISNKEEQDRIFYSMKDEMKTHDLKSKDIKKYIEYGWLYCIPDFKEENGCKLNFRDGLERLAGLEEYCARYELSSEVIHSTPLLIYSRKQSFYYLTLLSLYESFFRLEKVFQTVISKNVSPDQLKKYDEMRNLYYAQLIAIHKRESATFASIQGTKKIS